MNVEITKFSVNTTHSTMIVLLGIYKLLHLIPIRPTTSLSNQTPMLYTDTIQVFDDNKDVALTDDKRQKKATIYSRQILQCWTHFWWRSHFDQIGLPMTRFFILFIRITDRALHARRKKQERKTRERKMKRKRREERTWRSSCACCCLLLFLLLLLFSTSFLCNSLSERGESNAPLKGFQGFLFLYSFSPLWQVFRCPPSNFRSIEMGPTNGWLEIVCAPHARSSGA